MHAERAIFASVAAAGAVVTAAVAAFAGASAATSAGAGAVIALANFWALRRIVRSPRGVGLFLAPKQLALFGIVWLLLARHVVSAGPLALGYAALPIGVAIGALVCEKPAP